MTYFILIKKIKKAHDLMIIFSIYDENNYYLNLKVDIQNRC